MFIILHYKRTRVSLTIHMNNELGSFFFNNFITTLYFSSVG
jgi:hypothetical protein